MRSIPMQARWAVPPPALSWTRSSRCCGRPPAHTVVAWAHLCAPSRRRLRLQVCPGRRGSACSKDVNRSGATRSSDSSPLCRRRGCTCADRYRLISNEQCLCSLWAAALRLGPFQPEGGRECGTITSLAGPGSRPGPTCCLIRRTADGLDQRASQWLACGAGAWARGDCRRRHRPSRHHNAAGPRGCGDRREVHASRRCSSAACDRVSRETGRRWSWSSAARPSCRAHGRAARAATSAGSEAA